MVLCGIFMLIITKTIKVGLNEMIYFIIYAVPSWLLIMFGMMNQLRLVHMGGFWYFTLWFSLFFLYMTYNSPTLQSIYKTKKILFVYACANT
jgi:hypothetical protein